MNTNILNVLSQNYDICHVISHFTLNSGYEEDLSARYASIDKKRVLVLTTNIKYKVQGDSLFSRFIYPCIEKPSEFLTILRLPSIPFPSDLTSVSFIIPLLTLLSSRVYHVHGLRQPSSILACIWLTLMRKRVLVDTHDFYYKTHQLNYNGFNLYKNIRKIEFKFIRIPLGKIVLNLKSITIVSWGEICTEFIRKYYKFNGHINQLSIGYDGTIFFPRNRTVYKEEHVEIVFVGVLAPRKKPISLLKILQFLPLNYNLKFIGGYSSSMKNLLDKHITMMNLESRVTFIGHLSNQDLSNALRHSSLAIYPFSSSISCVQLLGCSIPVIISSNQKFAYLASRIGTQVNVDQRDSDDDIALKFAQKITSVMTNYNYHRNQALKYSKEYEYTQTYNSLAKLYFT